MRILLTAILMTLLPMSLKAQTATCANDKIIKERLQTMFNEKISGNGISKNGDVIELYTNEEAQTWSLIIIPSGTQLACLAASGNGAYENELLF